MSDDTIAAIATAAGCVPVLFGQPAEALHERQVRQIACSVAEPHRVGHRVEQQLLTEADHQAVAAQLDLGEDLAVGLSAGPQPSGRGERRRDARAIRTASVQPGISASRLPASDLEVGLRVDDGKDRVRALAANGCWWDPPFWREPSYLAQTAWDLAVLDRSFAVLQQLIRAEETQAACAWVNIKDAVEREQALASHPMSRDFIVLWPMSGLVRLALDAADANVLSHPELVRRLRGPHVGDFRGARFELHCLASFRNAGIDVTYDPMSFAAPGKKPDFLLQLSHRLFIDAKHVDEGAGVKEESSWFQQIAFDWQTGINADVRLTDHFRDLQRTADGRSWLSGNIGLLSMEVRAVKTRLANSRGPFPAVEVVENLVRVEVSGTADSLTHGIVMGVETDVGKEAQRIIRGAITRAAQQVPPGEFGAAILRAGWQVPAVRVRDELARWLDSEGEGTEYPTFVGGLIIEETFPEPLPQITGRVERVIPVWRRDVPRWVLEGPWDALSHAFALRDGEVLVKRCIDADPTWLDHQSR